MKLQYFIAGILVLAIY